MIDNISYQIIKALTEDGRCSYAKIAKDLKLNASIVSSKVNKMLEDNLISIQAVPNPYKIGYKFQTVIALKVDQQQIDNICDALVDNTYISSIAIMYGIYDILVLAEFPDIDMLIKLVQEHLPSIEGVINVETFLVAERKKSLNKFFKTESLIHNPVSLDKIDYQLIDELRKDGRANFARLAKKYGISTASVSRRVASLIKNDVIKITVVPNHTKLIDYTAVAYLAIKTELQKVNEICDQLSGFPEVHTIMTLINGYKILAILVLQNHEALYQFVKDKILSIDGVINVETLVRTDLKKRTYVYVDDTQIQEALKRKSLSEA